MAFDAHMEDFQRLGIRQLASLDAADPFGSARAMAGFGQRYAHNRDALPQTDKDRAYHLVVRATELIDYQLPFSSEAKAPDIIAQARRLLQEALELDPSCYDAQRMMAAANKPAFEQYYRFLFDAEPQVRAQSEHERDALQLPEGEARALAEDLVMDPYKRWLASLSLLALECGHYRICLSVGQKLLHYDPLDPADIRYTMALAYAKLEDAEGLAELIARFPDKHRKQNPWYELARLSLAFKARDFIEAQHIVDELIAHHAQAGTTLSRQDWLPHGVYARCLVETQSEDELILAVSEASVLLQEGCDAHERGTLGSWLKQQPSVRYAYTHANKPLPHKPLEQPNSDSHPHKQGGQS